MAADDVLAAILRYMVACDRAERPHVYTVKGLKKSPRERIAGEALL